jgi:hypothetical protein
VRLWLTVVVGFDRGSPQACGTPTRNPSGLAVSRVEREKGGEGGGLWLFIAEIA